MYLKSRHILLDTEFEGEGTKLNPTQRMHIHKQNISAYLNTVQTANLKK